ncbi:cytochrome c4 [bacterium SCSIO 12696]|nr:cytochrome c4 [bacterium SCSIO 12696]
MKQVRHNTILATAAALLLMSPVAMAEGNASAGKAKAATCGACHGETGNSPTPAFPKIAGLGEKYILKQMNDIKSGARQVPEMAGQLDAMSEQDMADIAAYFASNPMQISGAKEKDWPLEDINSAEFLALGEQVFRAGNAETGVPACTGCHSPSGQGNDPAGYPKIGGQFADYLAKQLKAFRSNARTNDGESRIMRDIAANMSDKEIEAVSNYISGLHIGAGE